MSRKHTAFILAVLLLALGANSQTSPACSDAAKNLRQQQTELTSAFMSHSGPERLRVGAENLLEAIKVYRDSCNAEALTSDCLGNIDKATTQGREFAQLLTTGVRNPGVIGGKAKTLFNTLISLRKSCGLESQLPGQTRQPLPEPSKDRKAKTVEEQRCMDGRFETRQAYLKIKTAETFDVNDAKALGESITFTQQSCMKLVSESCRKALSAMNVQANNLQNLEAGETGQKQIDRLQPAYDQAAQECPFDVRATEYSKSDTLTGGADSSARRRRRNLAEKNAPPTPNTQTPSNQPPKGKEPTKSVPAVSTTCETAQQTYADAFNQLRQDFREHKGKVESSEGFSLFIGSVKGVQQGCQNQLTQECSEGFDSVLAAAGQLADLLKRDERDEKEARAIRNELMIGIKTTRFECDLARFYQSEEAKRRRRV